MNNWSARLVQKRNSSTAFLGDLLPNRKTTIQNIRYGDRHQNLLHTWQFLSSTICSKFPNEVCQSNDRWRTGYLPTHKLQREELRHTKTVGTDRHYQTDATKTSRRSIPPWLKTSEWTSLLWNKYCQIVQTAIKSHSFGSVRHKLLYSLSSRWQFHSRVWSTLKENFYWSQVKVVMNCTLRTMTDFARFIKEIIRAQNCIFVPTFCIINQLPVTTEIDIDLNNQMSLYQLLLMSEECDARHLLYQTNTSGFGNVVQLIGSAGMEQAHGSEKVARNRVVVGSSVFSSTDVRNGLRFQAPSTFVIQ